MNIENSLYRIHALLDGDPIIWKFVEYTELHRQKVMDLMTPLGLAKRAWLHDMDKYVPGRMKAYAEYHYGERTPEVVNQYEQWHHSHVFQNEHHPQYWYETGRLMKFDAWCEMLSDWISAGICTNLHYKSSDTLDYYLKDDRGLLDSLPTIKKITEIFLKLYAEDISNFNLLLLKRIYNSHI